MECGIFEVYFALSACKHALNAYGVKIKFIE